jgi:hypothetical protein
VRDDCIDDASDLKMAQGDAIYTLERPTGMDTEQYIAGSAARASIAVKRKRRAQS